MMCALPFYLIVPFLARRGVVHRDLKAANLLIDEHDVSYDQTACPLCTLCDIEIYH
jgi:serine/threonine protein kinase